MLLDTVFSFELLLKNLCSSCHNMLSFSCIQQFGTPSPYDETSGVLFLVSVISFLFFGGIGTQEKWLPLFSFS